MRICSKALLHEWKPSTVVKATEPFVVRLHLGKFNSILGRASDSSRKHNSPKCKWFHSKAPQVATSHNCIYITQKYN